MMLPDYQNLGNNPEKAKINTIENVHSPLYSITHNYLELKEG